MQFRIIAENCRAIFHVRKIFYFVFSLSQPSSLDTLFLTLRCDRDRAIQLITYSIYLHSRVYRCALNAYATHIVINALSSGVLFQLNSPIVFIAYFMFAQSLPLTSCDMQKLNATLTQTTHYKCVIYRHFYLTCHQSSVYLAKMSRGSKWNTILSRLSHGTLLDREHVCSEFTQGFGSMTNPQSLRMSAKITFRQSNSSHVFEFWVAVGPR